MKIFGSITELVTAVFRKNSQQIIVKPSVATTYTATRIVELPPQDADGILVSATSTQTLTNKTLTSPVINTPTGIVKGDVGLGNVDNTSDATKNAAVATLTNKTLTGNIAVNLVSGAATVTLPTTTSNLATIALAETLTNKTLGSTNTLTGATASSFTNTGTVTLPTATDTLVGRATTDTLLNKTTISSTALATGALSLPAGTTGERPGTPANAMIRYNSTDASFEGYQAGAWSAVGGGSSGVLSVAQAAHGFVVGDVAYLNGANYAKAKADAANTAEVIGVVSTVTDANNFKLTTYGSISGLSGLTAGTNYFLSAATAGLLTATEPSTLGHVSVPVLIASSTTAGFVAIKRGIVVGGTNALTTISIANNATTTIQNVSAYQAGELTGYVSLVGTASQKFYIAAQFSKNAAGTDYNLSYQTSGETPVSGFSMTVTAAGLIQITLPSITGFSAASITYGLNVPAVGATFPLSVSEANLITLYQEKHFNGSVTAVGLLSATDSGFKFAGLTIGKRYTLVGRVHCDRNGTGSQRRFINVSAKNGSTTLAAMRQDNTDDNWGTNITFDILFTATATTIEIEAVSVAAASITGDGTAAVTTMRLFEATGMLATSLWT